MYLGDFLICDEEFVRCFCEVLDWFKEGFVCIEMMYFVDILWGSFGNSLIKFSNIDDVYWGRFVLLKF